NKEGDAVAKSPDPWGWGYRILVSFSPNGRILAVVREAGRIDLWEVDTGKKLRTLAADSSRGASFLAFSRDGTKLASAGGDNQGGDNTIRGWDVAAAKEVNPPGAPGAPISSVAAAPAVSTGAPARSDG